MRGYAAPLSTCLQLIETIVTDLNVDEMKSVTKVDREVAEKPLEPKSCSNNIYFSDIIGNQTAKQILYENIILPFSLDTQTRKAVFGGIRSGAGNVLLFGPPGKLP